MSNSKTYMGFKTITPSNIIEGQTYYVREPVAVDEFEGRVTEKDDFFIINIPDNERLDEQVIPNNAILIMGHNAVIKDCAINGYVHAYLQNSSIIDKLTIDVSNKNICRMIKDIQTLVIVGWESCFISETVLVLNNSGITENRTAILSTPYPKQPRVLYSKRVPYQSKDGYFTDLKIYARLIPRQTRTS